VALRWLPAARIHKALSLVRVLSVMVQLALAQTSTNARLGLIIASKRALQLPVQPHVLITLAVLLAVADQDMY
jgi:uncharacterized membrane protein